MKKLSTLGQGQNSNDPLSCALEAVADQQGAGLETVTVNLFSNEEVAVCTPKKTTPTHYTYSTLIH